MFATDNAGDRPISALTKKEALERICCLMSAQLLTLLHAQNAEAKG